MNSRRIVDIICVILGFGVILFGIMARAGMIPQTSPSRSIVTIIVGVIVVIWSWSNFRRHR